MHSVSFTTTSDANFEATFCLSCVAVKTEANVSFDNYKAISTKQCERELRGADDRVYINRVYVTLKQAGFHFLKNSNFK